MNTSTLKIEQTREQKTVTFHLSGDLLNDSVPPLAYQIEKAEAEGLEAVYLDLAQLGWLDSRAVGALVGWHRHFSLKEIEFRLLNVRGKPLQVLEVCNLTTLFNIGPAPADKGAIIRGQREALWKSHEYVEQLLAALGEGLIGVDPEGRILFANAAAERPLGRNEAELLGRFLGEAVRPVDKAGETLQIEQHPLLQITRGSTEVFHDEIYLGTRERGPVPFSVAVTPILQTQQLVGAVIGLLDITDRKRAEEAMLRVSRMEATATLAGGIAHEFNNLMVGVLGNSELLQMQYAQQSEVAAMLDVISQSAQRAGELAQQMLAFARGGKWQPKIINLNETLQRTLRLQERAFPPRIHVECDIEPDLWNIRADAAQLSQVVMNLCLNAVEAIEGGGRIILSTRNVEIDSGFAELHPHLSPGRHVCLSVRDTGSGMSPETLARVFEPFFTTKLQGRGMGLAAVYGIIRHHGGHITAFSKAGQGAEFKFYLPAAEGEITAPPRPERERLTGTETILVIDDEEIVLDITKKLLENFGYRVLLACNGQEAVDIAQRFEGEIHLAVLDMSMPTMGGAEVYPLLRKVRPELKVMICSGYELDTASQALLDAGACAFIQKPFRGESLGRQIRSILDD